MVIFLSKHVHLKIPFQKANICAEMMQKRVIVEKEVMLYLH